MDGSQKPSVLQMYWRVWEGGLRRGDLFHLLAFGITAVVQYRLIIARRVCQIIMNPLKKEEPVAMNVFFSHI